MIEKQRMIIHWFALAIGVVSLVLFFRGSLIGAGVGIMTMGIIYACNKKAGGELNVVIGLILILFYYEQRLLLILLSLSLIVAGLYDLLVIIKIKNNLTGEDKKQRGQELITKFREQELIHALCVKFIRLLGIGK